MAFRRNDFNTDDVVKKYLAGQSAKSLAAEFGFSRQVVYRVLDCAGITPRNRSESMYLRMAQATPEERQALSQNAHDAKRGVSNSNEALHKRALAGKRFIGVFEQEFIDAFNKAGIPTFPQQPFLSYNFDIGCGNIAVEIHTIGGNPMHRPELIRRTMRCLEAGMNILYVALPATLSAVPDVCYSEAIRIVNESRLNPPSPCKYWVIGRAGKIYAEGCFDGN